MSMSGRTYLRDQRMHAFIQHHHSTVQPLLPNAIRSGYLLYSLFIKQSVKLSETIAVMADLTAVEAGMAQNRVRLG